MNRVKVFKYTKKLLQCFEEDATAQVYLKNGVFHHEHEPAIIIKDIRKSAQYWLDGEYIGHTKDKLDAAKAVEKFIERVSSVKKL